MDIYNLNFILKKLMRIVLITTTSYKMCLKIHKIRGAKKNNLLLSLSSLIQKCIGSHPKLIKITKELCTVQELIILNNTDKTLILLPSHVVIEVNERANLLAKEAGHRNSISTETTLT
jgi:hypothetical protein